MPYQVINTFEDKEHKVIYKEGEIYPKEGYETTPDRISLLQSKKNKYKKVFIGLELKDPNDNKEDSFKEVNEDQNPKEDSSKEVNEDQDSKEDSTKDKKETTKKKSSAKK